MRLEELPVLSRTVTGLYTLCSLRPDCELATWVGVPCGGHYDVLGRRWEICRNDERGECGRGREDGVM